MKVQEQLQARKNRGYEIASKRNLKFINGKWSVPSQRTRNPYTVILRMDKSTCTCDDFTMRGIKCKHIFAVEITISKKLDEKGNITITETKKITYPQNWSQYDKSQIEEKSRFMELLDDLIKSVEEEQNKATGRPKIPIKDLIFASALKVYTQFSLRRFMSDLEVAKEKGFVRYIPCFASVGHFIGKESLTPILQELISLSSLPLKEVETQFAIDSTGFRTTRYSQYMRVKYDLKAHKEHEWLKAHVCCGVKTNIITAVEITDGFVNDQKEFLPLAERTNNNGFEIKELSADKGYTSNANLTYVNQIGAVPYIPFKSNAKPNMYSPKIWRRMYHYFALNRDEFLKHYHLRSNVESTFNMIKQKFNDHLKSKGKVAQINELLLKILCHNIVVVNNEISSSNLTLCK